MTLIEPPTFWSKETKSKANGSKKDDSYKLVDILKKIMEANKSKTTRVARHLDEFY